MKSELTQRGALIGGCGVLVLVKQMEKRRVANRMWMSFLTENIREEGVEPTVEIQAIMEAISEENLNEKRT